ncbi:MAG: tetratricopeptide repeat protein [Nitrospirota bacterium]
MNNKSTLYYVIIIILLTFLTYSNTFNVPFVYDDVPNIYENHYIKDTSLCIKYLKIKGILGIILTNRIIVTVSFCLNHHINGFNVIGYHAVNLAFHIANSVLLYFLMLMLFKSPFYQDYKFKTNYFTPELNSLLVAAIFAVHPIQTQSVTYVIQRSSLMLSFFMLLSLIAYIRMLLSYERHKKTAYYLISITFMFLAVKTKELSILLPILIFIIHVSFYKGGTVKTIINLIIFMLITVVIPIGIFMSSPGTLGELGVVKDTTPIESVVVNTTSPKYYFFTQLRVLVTYIRLLLFPVDQQLIYKYSFYTDFYNLNVFLSFVFIMIVILMAVYIYYLSGKKNMQLYRLSSVGIFWFFLYLSLYCTIIPSNDLIVEHRLYYSSIGFIIFAVITVAAIADNAGEKYAKTALLSLIIVVLTFSIASYKRNSVWQNEISLWNDVVSKSPDNANAHFNLGYSYLNNGDYDKAIDEFKKTVVMYRNNKLLFYKLQQIYFYLGISYKKIGSYDDAIDSLKRVIILSSGASHSNEQVLIDAYNELGSIYQDLNKYDKALEQYNISLNINKNYVKTHIYLGNYFIKINNIDQAIIELKYVANKKPNDLQVHYILGMLYKEKAMNDKAVTEFKKNIELNDKHAESYSNIGSIYIITKDYKLAEFYLIKALSLNPTSTEAQSLMRQLKMIMAVEIIP